MLTSSGSGRLCSPYTLCDPAYTNVLLFSEQVVFLECLLYAETMPDRAWICQVSTTAPHGVLRADMGFYEAV